MSSVPLTREVSMKPGQSTLLIIDVQKFCIPGDYVKKDADQTYFLDRMQKTTLPAIQNLLRAFRRYGNGKGERKADVIYTYIECLTKDGRDQSLDYKITGFHVPKGSEGAQILPEVAQEDDEIMIPKTSCSVFNSTNIEYVLRNLGTTQLVITGCLTNQCVESAVRDAADRGFLVTLPEDACATRNHEDHVQSLKNMKGFARIVSHGQVVDELEKW